MLEFELDSMDSGQVYWFAYVNTVTNLCLCEHYSEPVLM
jgi:hypothetical protein